jgi:hypothetical protein
LVAGLLMLLLIGCRAIDVAFDWLQGYWCCFWLILLFMLLLIDWFY